MLVGCIQGALRARDKDADGATARSAPVTSADAAAPAAAEETPDAVTSSASAPTAAAAADAAAAATNEVKPQAQQQPVAAVAKEEVSAATQVKFFFFPSHPPIYLSELMQGLGLAPVSVSSRLGVRMPLPSRGVG